MGEKKKKKKFRVRILTYKCSREFFSPPKWRRAPHVNNDILRGGLTNTEGWNDKQVVFSERRKYSFALGSFNLAQRAKSRDFTRDRGGRRRALLGVASCEVQTNDWWQKFHSAPPRSALLCSSCSRLSDKARSSLSRPIEKDYLAILSTSFWRPVLKYLGDDEGGEVSSCFYGGL